MRWELIRGKNVGRVQGALTGMMMTLKELPPLAYNKGMLMQEDKEGPFDALDTGLD